MNSAVNDTPWSDDTFLEVAEHYEAMSRSLSVALVNPTDRLVLGLDYVEYRKASIRTITPADDVAILYGPNSAPLVRSLFWRLGKETPPVIVVAPTVDYEDVRAAIAHGVTSYLIDDTTRRCLGEVVTKTSLGLRCLDPMVEGAIFGSVYAEPAVAVPRPSEASDSPSSIGALTPRETQIMQLIATGYSAAEVAAHLRLKEGTVRNNLTNIYGKLQVRRQSEAVMLWLGRQPSRPEEHPAPPLMTRSHENVVSIRR